MFEVPSVDGVEKVIVNKEVIVDNAKPLLVFSKGKNKKVS
jgi:ATP-dependent protease Clp ATPase subunit